MVLTGSSLNLLIVAIIVFSGYLMVCLSDRSGTLEFFIYGFFAVLGGYAAIILLAMILAWFS